MKVKALPARVKRGSLALLGAALVACGACSKAGPDSQTETKSAQAAQPRTTLVADSIARLAPSFMAYLSRVQFKDNDQDADRRLLVRSRSRPNDTTTYLGSKAELIPSDGAEQLPHNWPTYGAVLAKIVLHGDSAYPGLKLRPGVNYLCAPATASADSTFVAYMVSPGHGGNPPHAELLQMVMRSVTGPARFLLSPRDDGMCTPCDNRYCCTM